MGPAARRAGIAAILLLAAAAPPRAAAPNPQPRPPSTATAPAIRHAGNPDIVDQLLMLEFDADPGSGTPAREKLARWTDDIRVFVSADAAIQREVDADAEVFSRLTGLPIIRVAGGQPNVFLAVSAMPVEAFRGPQRRLLTLAFAGDEPNVDRYIDAVVAIEACWVVPVWADAARTTIKAAVIGIDARQGHPGVERCVTQKLAAALGLLGPSGYLPRSVFTPRSGATKLSFEHQLMLRVLYDPALAPGMSRADADAAAAAALQRLRPR